MEIHDSLMKAAIEEKYGVSFFARTSYTADSLDAAGAGLTLPCFIQCDSTAAYLKRRFDYLDTVRFSDEEGFGERVLLISFSHGKLKSFIPLYYENLKRRASRYRLPTPGKKIHQTCLMPAMGRTKICRKRYHRDSCFPIAG